MTEAAYKSLSPEEQDRVFGDLYGTEEPIGETPEFVNEKLADLDRELGLLSDEIKRHYTCALRMGKNQAGNNVDEYVTSPKFRLMFLRADRFDAQKAARRLARFFSEKFEIFGEESLARKITRDDFRSHEDKKALITGGFSFNGATDWAGRSIVIFRREQALKENLISLRRVVFFIMQYAVEDNEISQKKGIVAIAYNMPVPRFTQRPSDIRVMFPIARMAVHGLPFRHAASHIFYKSNVEHVILNLLTVVLPADTRARMHCHQQETHLECMLKLIQFGINPDTLPIGHDGNFRNDMIIDYLQKKQQEQMIG